jgi:hypothetical protein
MGQLLQDNEVDTQGVQEVHAMGSLKGHTKSGACWKGEALIVEDVVEQLFTSAVQ